MTLATILMWFFTVWGIGAALFFLALELNRNGIGPKADGRTSFEIVENHIGRPDLLRRMLAISLVWPMGLVILINPDWAMKHLD